MTLESALSKVLGRVCGGPNQPPMPTRLLIAEAAKGTTSATGQIILPRSALQTPEQYSSRFEELMTSDFSWVHLSYCGIFEGGGLVLVDYPRQRSKRRGTDPVPTSLNFSGPQKRVADAGWDASVDVMVVPGDPA